MEPGIGDLNRRGRTAKFFEQRGQRRGVERSAQRGTAIGDGPAIIGKVGATGLDSIGQGYGLPVGGLDQRGDFGGTDFAAMALAQRGNGGEIELASRYRVIDGERKIMIVIANIAP